MQGSPPGSFVTHDLTQTKRIQHRSMSPVVQYRVHSPHEATTPRSVTEDETRRSLHSLRKMRQDRENMHERPTRTPLIRSSPGSTHTSIIAGTGTHSRWQTALVSYPCDHCALLSFCFSFCYEKRTCACVMCTGMLSGRQCVLLARARHRVVLFRHQGKVQTALVSGTSTAG